MTIRYVCEQCEAVIKIKDELAGKKTKCPKCKAPFLIPQPTPGPTEASTEKPPAVMIDMPLEITPKVNLADTDLLEASRPEPVAVDTSAPKPSIAELMREHEASKKKKPSQEAERPAQSVDMSSMINSGSSAADMINKSYDEKRNSASAPPPLTREEQRAVEMREAGIEFAKKAVPAVIGLVIVMYFVVSYMMSESYPDLFSVTGVVKQNGAPLPGVVVQFAPSEGEASSGITNAQGEYVLYYDEENGVDGVIAGKHSVKIIYVSSGIEAALNPSDLEKEVTDDSEINFNVQ